ncbi:MAG: BREX system P-loop protein BrxC [Bacteroidales bacterium]|nr:BREX system P-loop protein BrxC [Bacteroidales bacterium]
MLNKELFVLNPDENNLKNDGVADLSTSRDEPLGLELLYHEIKTFVCEGEYEKGLVRILSTYLRNLDQPEQPAVWISGFFGSGKSHLLKMLTYFWEDFKFNNGQSAREIKKLPEDLNDLLVELSRKQSVNGSLVVRGNLRDFPSKDLRYSFLQLLLNSLGLPSHLHHFQFYYWCHSEGILKDLKKIIEDSGKDFRSELNNLFVSKNIAEAIIKLIPGYAEDESQVRENLRVNFKRVETINREEFLYTIKSQILPLYFKEIPCTLVALDEVQQFIGSDEQKSFDVQVLAQDLCKNFDGQLLLVGTGQNALTETPLLQKLNDRFTVKVPLTDKDVETVTRKTVLEKKATAITTIEKKLDQKIGEISRLLDGTEYGYTTADKDTMVADYPILPSTRKFWKKILQAIDVAGTSGQLRSQLRIVDESVKAVADKELGKVIPADFIFEQKKHQLIQNALLLNDQSNIIEELYSKGGDSALKARILAITFLSDQLPKDTPHFRLKSDKKTIADLLIDNMNSSTDDFRNKIGLLIDELVNTDKHLIPIGDEYKLQTRVGAEWEQEYTMQANKIRNDDERLYSFRKEKIINHLHSRLRTISILQGKSKERREYYLYDGETKPSAADKLNIWFRDGWLESENTLLDEIRAEGTDESLAYIFIQKVKEQELKREIIKYLAAEATLNEKGIPSTPEGDQARRSMETRKKMALIQIGELVDSICKEAKVYLAGGTLIDQGSLAENVKKALDDVSIRQFPDFRKADYNGWAKALRKALNNNSEALREIDYNNETKDHPMTADILNFIGNASKQGKEIRANFIKSRFGWSQDAIDTMLVVLKLTDHITTSETNLNQKTIAQASFKQESFTLTAVQKIEIRKLYQVAGIHCKSGEESRNSNEFLRKLDDLAEQTYGDAPKLESVDKSLIQEIENLDGNERLLKIFENKDQLKSDFELWTKQSETIGKRIPEWEILIGLNRFATENKETKPIKEEIDAIRNERLILREPDPIQSPLSKMTDYLWNALNEYKKEYNRIWDEKMAELQTNEYWIKIQQEDKHRILVEQNILAKSEIKAYASSELLVQLNKISLDAWADKVSALLNKFQNAIDEAIKLCAPKAEPYNLPRRTIKNETELEAYLDELRKEIKSLLNNGDVILK